MPVPHTTIISRNLPRASTLVMLAMVWAVYWLGVLRHVDLPGLYMDAINPDYLATRLLHPELANPVWVLPFKGLPLLGNLYHGLQNLYLGLPFYWLWGTSLISARLVHGLIGAAIVTLVWCITARVSRSRLLATCAAIALASDIALIASFRTQNYIILTGMAWLLGSLLALLPPGLSVPSARRLWLSGGLAGMAVYGYFVLGFFLPAILLWLFLRTPKEYRLVAALRWCMGVAIGMIGYWLGYLSMAIALGGPAALLDFVTNSSQSLAPFSSTLSLLGGYAHAIEMVRLALGNGGNERMMFDTGLMPSTWLWVKLAVLPLALGGLLITAIRARRSADPAFVGRACAYGLLAAMPLSYLVFGGVLGQRLWVHHYAVLVPLFYLLAGLALAVLLDRFPHRARTWVLGISVVTLLLLNGVHQNRFFTELERTGGAARTSQALTQLAKDALASPLKTAYVFPDWGFFMPFAFETGNRVSYRLELSPEVIAALRPGHAQVALAFWDPKALVDYERRLQDLGLKQPQLKTYSRRDGSPAFFVLTADF